MPSAQIPSEIEIAQTTEMSTAGKYDAVMRPD
jgi:hypothetical protein